MNRSLLRRGGGLFLLLAWGPVATANAVPCALFCLLEARLAHPNHAMEQGNPLAGHHMPGARISAPEHCSAPELLVVAFVPPELPTPPSIVAVVADMQVPVVIPMQSAPPEFGTPPPRA